MKARRRSILISLIALLVSIAISPVPIQDSLNRSVSQSLENSPTGIKINSEDIEFERIVLPGGVSSKIIQSIAQDQQGFIWIGTEGGLYKFDGYEFTLYPQDTRDTVSFANDIEIVFIDSHNTIWVGTINNGINRLSLKDQEMGVFERFTHSPGKTDSLNSNAVLSMVADQSGHLWVGTLNGLHLYDPIGKRFLQLDSGEFDQFFSGVVMDLFVDYSGLLWVGSIGSLDKLDITAHRFIPFSNLIIQEQIILAGFVDQNGDHWFGTLEDGLY